jgi:hypothetical protein
MKVSDRAVRVMRRGPLRAANWINQTGFNGLGGAR